MKSEIRWWLLLLGLALLSGCNAEYVDVSKDDQYIGLVGTKYETLVELQIQGVTLSRSGSKSVDQYVVTEKPGFTGREVIEKKNLKVGSTIRVKAVKKCANCLPPSVEFIIEIPSEELGATVPIWLYDLSIKDNQGNSVMDPKKLSRVGD